MKCSPFDHYSSSSMCETKDLSQCLFTEICKFLIFTVFCPVNEEQDAIEGVCTPSYDLLPIEAKMHQLTPDLH